VVPFKGEVGKTLVAAKVKEAMAFGLKDPKTVLVLDFDSPGGAIVECEAILELLAQQKERRTIAVVKSAYSAAAILALACDEIYMQENSSIGCAQAIVTPPQAPAPPELPAVPSPPQRQPGPEPAVPPRDATPGDGDAPGRRPPAAQQVTAAPEKIQSVWRSICRRAAEIGGHSSLYAEAMVDPALQIRLVEKDGRKTVEQFLTPTEEDARENRILKTSGKLLTLTGKEAVRCGLARAVVAQFGEVEKKASGLAGWRPVSDRGEKIMDSFRAKVEKAEKTFEAEAKKFSDSLRIAVAEDPSKKRYEVDSKGNLTQHSYNTLVTQCKRCLAHLNACEIALKKIAELGKDHPFLEEAARAAQLEKTEVQSARERVREFAKRFRMPPRALGL
jgi:ATP-dependent protease ClpP protease subunit